MDLLNYFAFGSNMASQRLLQRLPEATLSGLARLDQHRLSFRKNLGQSGKCDIEFTGKSNDIVIGVIYQISSEDRLVLDQYEGLGWAYDSKQVEVTPENVAEGRKDEKLTALTYYGIDIGETDIPPYHWYKEHVLRGAIEHRFPEQYIAFIESFESVQDPDQQRSERELSIYQ